MNKSELLTNVPQMSYSDAATLLGLLWMRLHREAPGGRASQPSLPRFTFWWDVNIIIYCVCYEVKKSGKRGLG